MSAQAHPAVSVCVPTYNGAAHLAKCLDSVLAQTFVDFEIVLVDSGSTDATLEIARQYAQRDSRFRIIEVADRVEMVANWNRALALARGEWIKFVFQDDALMPRCVEALLAHARQHAALFVACLRQIHVEGPRNKTWVQFYLDNLKLVASLYPAGRLSAQEVADFAIAQVGINFVGEPVVTLIHRSVFEKVGAFDPAIVQRVDTEFWVRAGIHTGVAMVREELAVFRVHGGSASARNYATRAYANVLLEPAFMLHQYLFDVRYAPLRARAIETGMLGEIEKRFGEACRRAGAIAMDAARPDAGQISADWQRVTALYPRLAQAAGQIEPLR